MRNGSWATWPSEPRSRPDEIDTSLPFNSYGVDSTEAAGLSGELSEWLGIELSESVAFEHPTIDGLSAYVWEELDIAS